MTIDEMIENVIAKEGGYGNHPSDKGGETCWGITVAVARAYGYQGAMNALPRDLAKKIYLARYVQEPKFDKVSQLSPTIAEELVDTGINMGQAVATTFLQRWLNAFNLQGTLYPDGAVDGRIGTLTLAALQTYLKRRGRDGEAVMVRALNCSQGARYLELAEGRPQNEDFVYGWLVGRVG